MAELVLPGDRKNVIASDNYCAACSRGQCKKCTGFKRGNHGIKPLCHCSNPLHKERKGMNRKEVVALLIEEGYAPQVAELRADEVAKQIILDPDPETK